MVNKLVIEIKVVMVIKEARVSEVVMVIKVIMVNNLEVVIKVVMVMIIEGMGINEVIVKSMVMMVS